MSKIFYLKIEQVSPRAFSPVTWEDPNRELSVKCAECGKVDERETFATAIKDSSRAYLCADCIENFDKNGYPENVCVIILSDCVDERSRFYHLLNESDQIQVVEETIHSKVAKMFKSGMSVRDIAEALDKAPSTIQGHIDRIRRDSKTS